MTTKRSPWAGLAAAAALVLLAGCAANGPNRSAAGASVEDRAVQRWEYLIASEAEKAYDYLTPGYRATRTRDAYAAAMNNRPVRWTAVEYDGQECEDEDRCTVSLSVKFKAPMGPGGRMQESISWQHETWLKSGGVWYHLPSR